VIVFELAVNLALIGLTSRASSLAISNGIGFAFEVHATHARLSALTRAFMTFGGKSRLLYFIAIHSMMLMMAMMLVMLMVVFLYVSSLSSTFFG
jgi:hypothetical protein